MSPVTNTTKTIRCLWLVIAILLVISFYQWYIIKQDSKPQIIKDVINSAGLHTVTFRFVDSVRVDSLDERRLELLKDSLLNRF